VTQERASAAYPLVSNQSTVAKAERAPSTEVGQTTMTWSARSKIARIAGCSMPVPQSVMQME